MSSIYGGFGLFLILNADWWNANKILGILIQQMIFFVAFGIVIFTSMRILRKWRLSLPKE